MTARIGMVMGEVTMEALVCVPEHFDLSMSYLLLKFLRRVCSNDNPGAGVGLSVPFPHVVLYDIHLEMVWSYRFAAFPPPADGTKG